MIHQKIIYHVHVPFILGIKDGFSVFRSTDVLHYRHTLKDRNDTVILIAKEGPWTKYNILS